MNETNIYPLNVGELYQFKSPRHYDCAKIFYCFAISKLQKGDQFLKYLDGHYKNKTLLFLGYQEHTCVLHTKPKKLATFLVDKETVSFHTSAFTTTFHKFTASSTNDYNIELLIKCITL